MDLIVNLAPVGVEKATEYLRLLNEGGSFISIVRDSFADKTYASKLGVNAIQVRTAQNSEQLKQIAALVENGQVKPNISVTLPFNDFISAQGLIGKINGKAIFTNFW